jgi:hypothetical protein
MSLIHEALKRADACKVPGGSPPPAIPPIPHMPRPPTDLGHRSMKRQLIVAMAIALVAMATAAAILLRHEVNLPRATLALTPAPAPGTDGPADEATLAAAVDTLVEPESPKFAAPSAPLGLSPAELDRSTMEPSAPPKEEPPQPVAPVYGSRPTFKVNAIMSGPDGGAALINGRMVNVGQTIDGARLVSVSPNAVQLLVGDRQMTVGLQE